MLPLCFSSFFHESPRWLSSYGKTNKSDQNTKTNPTETSKESVNHNVNKQESGDPSVFTKSYQTSEESCNAKEIRSNESIKSQLSESSPLNNSGKSERAHGSLFDLMRTPGLRLSTIVLAYIWCVFLIIFLFVLMNCKEIIPGNSTLNIEILSGMDLIAGILTYPIVAYTDRRLSTSICFFSTGVSFLCRFFIPYSTYKQVFAQLGLFFNTLCFNLMSVFTVEIYPTVIRSTALGTLNAIGRISAMAPPLLLLILNKGEECLILGIMAVLAVGMIWLLPETRGVEMVDSLEEGEMFNRTHGGLRLWKKGNNDKIDTTH